MFFFYKCLVFILLLVTCNRVYNRIISLAWILYTNLGLPNWIPTLCTVLMCIAVLRIILLYFIPAGAQKLVISSGL